jgi:hypothetical protein
MKMFQFKFYTDIEEQSVPCGSTISYSLVISLFQLEVLLLLVLFTICASLDSLLDERLSIEIVFKSVIDVVESLNTGETVDLVSGTWEICVLLVVANMATRLEFSAACPSTSM